jgi:hypothetical protein
VVEPLCHVRLSEPCTPAWRRSWSKGAVCNAAGYREDGSQAVNQRRLSDRSYQSRSTFSPECRTTADACNDRSTVITVRPLPMFSLTCGKTMGFIVGVGRITRNGGGPCRVYLWMVVIEKKTGNTCPGKSADCQIASASRLSNQNVSPLETYGGRVRHHVRRFRAHRNERRYGFRCSTARNDDAEFVDV